MNDASSASMALQYQRAQQQQGNYMLSQQQMLEAQYRYQQSLGGSYGSGGYGTYGGGWGLSGGLNAGGSGGFSF